MAALDSEVVVVGAGLVGAACALHLAQAGREVVLLDAEPGLGASFGNAGHVACEQVVPLANPQMIAASWRYLLDPDGPLRLRAAYLLPLMPWLARFVWAARPAALARGVAALTALQRTSRADLQDLMARAGLDPLLRLEGYLRIWETAQGEREAHAQAADMARYGVATEVVSAAQVHAEAPGLGPQVAGAICYPETGHVIDPYAVCMGLVDALERHGGRLERGRATGIAQPEGAPVVVSREDGRPLRCRQVLVCAGAWSRPLVEGLGYRMPLDTERGYHITVPWPQDGAPRALARRPIASTERHVIATPMSVGLRLTGTLEFGGLHLPPNPRRYALLRRQMAALLPGVDTTQASTWMGFRPSLPDHMPVLGASPRHPGVFFAFGHQHLGLTLCGVTARVVCALMLGGAPSLDLAPYRVDRFS